MKDKKKPLVSVCIPTYNRVKKLEFALSKILKQSYENIEVIVSDNCSTDTTAEVCEKLQKKDDRIKYFRHETNNGASVNFEFARKQAKGQYFLWHGDDDYLDNNYIERCVNELEQDISLVLVSGLGAYKKYGVGETTYYGNIIQPNSDLIILRVVKYLWNVQENSIFCGIYRMKEVEFAYMPNVLAGDWIWIVEVLLKGKGKVLPNVHVTRSYGDSTSVSYENIVASINGPVWHAKFPNIAMSSNMFSFFKSVNVFIGITGCLILMIKGLWNNFKRYSGLYILKRFAIKICNKGL